MTQLNPNNFKTQSRPIFSLHTAGWFILCAGVALSLGFRFFLSPDNPRREFRGVWIASVSNIDFPSRRGLDKAAFVREWKDLTDFYAQKNFNALIVQVRPSCDAFYPSRLGPWSVFLTGKQGLAPKGDFDPMEEMIRETHKKGMEFHAWLNPYRAAMDADTASLDAMHPLKQHPEWGIFYGGKWYLNPALPEVRYYITEVIEELLIHYDVDAIHFDDYFYPYKVAGEPYPDSLYFEKYGTGFFFIDDWRRHNVDELIRLVSKKIKSVSPHVKFGISPFGVYRNKSEDPVNGSETRAGQTCYDDLYYDIIKWLQNEWIDYVVPQIYWHKGFPPADYETLLDWWNEHAYDRHVYVGLAAYKVGNNPEQAWYSPKEMPRQIDMARTREHISGQVFFSSRSLEKNPLGLVDSLVNRHYSTKAILPEFLFLDVEPPVAPMLDKVRLRKGHIRLSWRRPEREPAPARFAIYRFEDTKPGDFDDPHNLLAVTPVSTKKTLEFTDKTAQKGKTYTYVVSAINRANRESDLSNYRTVRLKSLGIKRIR